MVFLAPPLYWLNAPVIKYEGHVVVRMFDSMNHENNLIKVHVHFVAG